MVLGGGLGDCDMSSGGRGTPDFRIVEGGFEPAEAARGGEEIFGGTFTEEFG